MQYKLYVGDATWLPKMPELDGTTQLLKHVTVIDIPQLFAVGGTENFYRALGLNDLATTAFVTDAGLREKLNLLTRMLPLLHDLQERSLKEMAQRMDAQAAGLIQVSSEEKAVVERTMIQSISTSQGGCIVWILTQSNKETLPPIESISPRPFNLRNILLPTSSAPVAPSVPALAPFNLESPSPSPVAAPRLSSSAAEPSITTKMAQKADKKAQALIAIQSKIKAAVALRAAVSNRVLKEVQDGLIIVVDSDEYGQGKIYSCYKSSILMLLYYILIRSLLQKTVVKR